MAGTPDSVAARSLDIAVAVQQVDIGRKRPEEEHQELDIRLDNGELLAVRWVPADNRKEPEDRRAEEAVLHNQQDMAEGHLEHRKERQVVLVAADNGLDPQHCKIQAEVDLAGGQLELRKQAAVKAVVRWEGHCWHKDLHMERQVEAECVDIRQVDHLLMTDEIIKFQLL